MPDQETLTPSDNQQTTDNQPETKPAGSAATTPKGDAPPETKPTLDWRSSLPDDLRTEKMFENIKGKDAAEVLPTLAKGYRDAQKLVGGSMGKLPAKGAPEAEVKKWQADNLPKLREAGLVDGPPAEPSGYTAKLVKGGEALPVSPDVLAGVFQKFHKLGLSNTQAQEMLNLYVEQSMELGGDPAVTMATLEKEFGGATQMMLKRSQFGARALGGDELVDLFEATGLGNHPVIIKAFAKAGAHLEEDDPVFKDTVQNSIDETKAKKAAIMNDSKHPYWNREHPGHKDAVAEMTRLNEVIFAQQQ